MEKQSVAITRSAKEAAPPELLPASNFFDRIADEFNSIARRSSEIFGRRPRADGYLAELTHLGRLDIAQSDYAYNVHVELPGFSANELEVGVEPHRLTIRDKRGISPERPSKKTAEQCTNTVLGVIDLPADVDSSTVVATLKDGVLELSMQKVAKA